MNKSNDKFLRSLLSCIQWSVL